MAAQDEKILRREVLRLRMSLEEGQRLAAGRPLVVMMHYPPLFRYLRETPFTEVLADYPVHLLVYGHLHGQAIHTAFSGTEKGIDYRLVSCDALDFKLMELPL